MKLITLTAQACNHNCKGYSETNNENRERYYLLWCVWERLGKLQLEKAYNKQGVLSYEKTYGWENKHLGYFRPHWLLGRAICVVNWEQLPASTEVRHEADVGSRITLSA